MSFRAAILPLLLNHTDSYTLFSSLPFFSTLCFFNTYGFSQLLFSSGNRHHLSLSVITSPVFLNCLKRNSTISSSCLTSLSPSYSHLLSFSLSVTQQDHYTLCVCVCFCIYLSIYLAGITMVTDFWCYVSLACMSWQQPGHCIDVSQFIGHVASTSLIHADPASLHMEHTYGHHL